MKILMSKLSRLTILILPFFIQLTQAHTASIHSKANLSGEDLLCKLHADSVGNCFMQAIDQASALDCYKPAFMVYTQGLNYRINHNLRYPDRAQSSACTLLAQHIAHGLTLLPSLGAITVYRGIHGLDPYAKFKEGECFIDRAFSSTSLKKKIAKIFSKGGAYLEIESTGGKDISQFSGDSEEAEILFKPGTTYKIIKAYRNFNTKRSYESRYKIKEVSAIEECSNDI